MPRSPYAGRRLPTASAPQADEGRLVARYEQVKNIAQCARAFGISPKAVRAILDRHGIPHGSPGPHTRRPPAAEGAHVPRR
jgi:hypothetical protein